MKVSSLGGVYKPYRGLTELNWEADLSWKDLHFPYSKTAQARLLGLLSHRGITFKKFLLVVSTRALIQKNKDSLYSFFLPCFYFWAGGFLHWSGLIPVSFSCMSLFFKQTLSTLAHVLMNFFHF